MSEVKTFDEFTPIEWAWYILFGMPVYKGKYEQHEYMKDIIIHSKTWMLAGDRARASDMEARISEYGKWSKSVTNTDYAQLAQGIGRKE